MTRRLNPSNYRKPAEHRELHLREFGAELRANVIAVSGCLPFYAVSIYNERRLGKGVVEKPLPGGV